MTVAISVLLAVDAAAARDEARRILAEDPFRQRSGPRPFEAVLRRLGDWFVDPLQRGMDRLGDALPGVNSAAGLLAAVVVVVVAAVVAARLVGDRGRSRLRPGGHYDVDTIADPDELDRAAEAAERSGDLEAALRLRFRAGLVRLDQVGAIDLRPGLTNRAVLRRLCSRRFAALARRFDEVAYGGEPATAADLAESRAQWPEVVQEAVAR